MTDKLDELKILLTKTLRNFNETRDDKFSLGFIEEYDSKLLDEISLDIDYVGDKQKDSVILNSKFNNKTYIIRYECPNDFKFADFVMLTEEISDTIWFFEYKK